MLIVQGEIKKNEDLLVSHCIPQYKFRQTANFVFPLKTMKLTSISEQCNDLYPWSRKEKKE
jgi:hypothetical protein